MKEKVDGTEQKTRNLTNQIRESELARQSLLQKLEASNAEVTMLSHHISRLQESSLLSHQLEGEVMQLRQSLADQQSQRLEHQQARERCEKELNVLKTEGKQFRDRLEQSSKQLSEMQQRSEEWRKERESLNKRIKEVVSIMDTEFLICFEAWAKIVCVPLGIHLEAINKQLMLLVII